MIRTRREGCPPVLVTARGGPGLGGGRLGRGGVAGGRMVALAAGLVAEAVGLVVFMCAKRVCSERWCRLPRAERFLAVPPRGVRGIA